VSNWDRTVAR